MTDKKELADIREEWGFVQKNSGPGHAIAVHGGWLVGAMTQMFDYINDLEVAAKVRHQENMDLEERVANLKEKLSDHEEGAKKAREKLDVLIHEAEVREADIEGMVAELHPAP